MFMHTYDGFTNSGFWPILMMIIMGLFWILLISLIVVLIVKLISHKPTTTHHDRETPLEILEKEYAKGNISEEEFLKRKKNLQ